MSTLTVSEAKAKFGQLAERTLRTGKPVVIRHKGRLIQIAPHSPAKRDRFFPVGSLRVTKRQLELDTLAGPDLGPDAVWSLSCGSGMLFAFGSTQAIATSIQPSC